MFKIFHISLISKHKKMLIHFWVPFQKLLYLRSDCLDWVKNWRLNLKHPNLLRNASEGRQASFASQPGWNCTHQGGSQAPGEAVNKLTLEALARKEYHNVPEVLDAKPTKLGLEVKVRNSKSAHLVKMWAAKVNLRALTAEELKVLEATQEVQLLHEGRYECQPQQRGTPTECRWPEAPERHREQDSGRRLPHQDLKGLHPVAVLGSGGGGRHDQDWRHHEPGQS